MASTCIKCKKRVKRNSIFVICNNCNNKQHRRCFAICTDADFDYLSNPINQWFCNNCTDSCLPLGNIENDSEYLQLCRGTRLNQTVSDWSDKTINPIDIEEDYNSPLLDDLDPDTIF